MRFFVGTLFKFDFFRNDVVIAEFDVSMQNIFWVCDERNGRIAKGVAESVELCKSQKLN